MNQINSFLGHDSLKDVKIRQDCVFYEKYGIKNKEFIKKAIRTYDWNNSILQALKSYFFTEELQNEINSYFIKREIGVSKLIVNYLK
jgi:hypothetical protein